MTDRRAEPRRRRLVITVCPYERGTVAIPVERGGPMRRLDARAIARELDAVIAARGLAEVVRVREGCAGGCAQRGPNVGVTIYPLPAPGERPDNIAIGWRTYVGSLDALDCLAAVLDENLDDGGPRRAPHAPHAPGPGIAGALRECRLTGRSSSRRSRRGDR